MKNETSIHMDRMLLYDYNKNKNYLRFKFYGDFDMMKWVAQDCIEDLSYIGNSSVDAAPVFIYKFDEIDTKLLRDFQQLNAHLRNLRIRNISKKDLTKKEKSLLTFLSFFMNNDEKRLIMGVRDSEIKELYDWGEKDKYDD